MFRQVQERITSTKNGSITSVQAVYVPADDLTDPAPAITFAHLDATTVLSRKIVEQGIYPAVDPLESNSRILEPDIVGEEHYNVARKTQELLQKYKELQDIYDMTARINSVLKEMFAEIGIRLIDFKIEFGRKADGTVVLADEISPDTCRLWDMKTNEKLDKDRFRRDLGHVIEAYEEIDSRLNKLGK